MMDTFCHILKVFSMLVQFYLSPLCGAVTHQKYVIETFLCYFCILILLCVQKSLSDILPELATPVGGSACRCLQLASSTNLVMPAAHHHHHHLQGHRNISGRPGASWTNNWTNKNFYVHILSDFVNVKMNPIVLSLWPLSLSAIFTAYLLSAETLWEREASREWQSLTGNRCRPTSTFVYLLYKHQVDDVRNSSFPLPQSRIVSQENH